MGLDLVADLLACPHCHGPLGLADAVLGCAEGHRFDVARQGYANLLPTAPPANADTAAMVDARERFLATGAYEPVVAALRHHLGEPGGVPRTVVDAGAGPGWYLAQLLDSDRTARGLALDVSVPAVRRAARRHRRMAAVVADTWTRLPVRDASADVVLSVFAPRHPAEFHRVLSPVGLLAIVAAEPDHLADLRAELGLLDVEPTKDERLRRSLASDFTVVGSERVEISLVLDASAVADLVGMGPNAFHAGVVEPTADRQVTAAVRVTVARPT